MFLKMSSVIIFPTSFIGKWIFNKDPTVWLNGARNANTHIPPFFLGNVPVQPTTIPTKKYVRKYIKMNVCESKRNKKT
jgi:hypothetical protein